jgi:hypothetical protein
LEWAVKGMSVAREVWDEGFNNGASLVGCGGMGLGYVSSCPPVDINALMGSSLKTIKSNKNYVVNKSILINK